MSINIQTVTAEDELTELNLLRTNLELNIAKLESGFILYSLENNNKLTSSIETNYGNALLLSNNQIDFNPELMKLNQCLLLSRPECISYSSKLIIFNTSRERRTILSLLIENHKKLIENNIEINLILVPTNLQEYFEQLGYCQYAKAGYNTEGLSLVPMLLLAQDYYYLSLIGSPLARNCHETKIDRSKLREVFGKDYKDPRIYLQLKQLASRFNIKLDEKLIEPYLGVLKYNVFKAGENIFRENEAGSSLHIITNGITKINQHKYKAGGFFGIDSLLNPGNRRYTLEAESKVETLEIESEDFYKIIRSKPNTTPMILNLLGERLRDIHQ